MSEPDPHFGTIVAEIRGFDLGDDKEVFSDLSAREKESAEGLDGEGWLLKGVLHFRKSEAPDAIACFQKAAELEHSVSQARYLQSQMLLVAGMLDQAAATLELAENAAKQDLLVPTAELVHARGSILRARGVKTEALSVYRQALKEDPQSGARWLHAGRLMFELGELPEAARAFENAATADGGDDPVYERAAVAACTGDLDVAASWLARALQADGRYERRAHTDPRFDKVREVPPLSELLAAPPQPDLTWLSAFPAWLQALRGDPDVEALGLRWLNEREARDLTNSLLRMYERGPIGTMHTGETIEHSRALLASMRPIARGPSSQTRDGLVEPSYFFVDRQVGDRLWLALSENYPPYLWLDSGITATTLAHAIRGFFPPRSRTRVEMPGVARGFIGYRLRFGVPNPIGGDVEPANAAELDRHFSINPFVESGAWGSAYEDDPWPDHIPAQPSYVLKVAARQQRVAEQARGSVWSVSRRTRHSRSYVSFELHHRDVFVAEARYVPSHTAATIAAMNDHFGSDYPTDMPVDVIAALMGFQFDSASDLKVELDSCSESEEIAGLLTVMSALRHSDLGMSAVYRRYMDHPDAVVRTTLCNIFAEYNRESLIEEMSATEPDEEIRVQIEALLDEGIGITEHNPFLDYAEDDDAADDDDDDDLISGEVPQS